MTREELSRIIHPKMQATFNALSEMLSALLSHKANEIINELAEDIPKNKIPFGGAPSNVRPRAVGKDSQAGGSDGE